MPSINLAWPNRGLAFGDGFFETLVIADGQVRYAAHHVARMQRAAEQLYLTLPAELASPRALTATLARLAEANQLPAARLRVQLWRSGGGRYTPLTNQLDWLATAEAFTPDNSPIQLAGFAEQTQAQYSPLSFCKGPQAWLYVRAAHERQRRNLDEIFLCDGAGHVAEAGASAIFWLRGGTLFTPALSTGCVAGVRRQHLLTVARRHDLPCQEGLFTREDLSQAEAVFTANVASIRTVLRLGGTTFETEHPVLQQLLAWERQA